MVVRKISIIHTSIGTTVYRDKQILSEIVVRNFEYFRNRFRKNLNILGIDTENLYSEILAVSVIKMTGLQVS